MNTTVPPYPADTRAKGWRFELDYEQIEQSSTWALAGQEARPWLLMLWLTSWRQVPCGSFPPEEPVIAAMIGASPKVWARFRAVLMRGWYVAADGRMYHATVSARVLEMLDYRKKNADRVAKFKAAKREQRTANALPTEQQLSSNATGTGTGNKEKPSEAKASGGQPPSDRDMVFALGVPLLTAAGVKESNARSFLAAQSKAHGDAAVVGALEQCSAAKPIQPIPWLQTALKPRAGKHTGFESKDYRQGVEADGSLA